MSNPRSGTWVQHAYVVDGDIARGKELIIELQACGLRSLLATTAETLVAQLRPGPAAIFAADEPRTQSLPHLAEYLANRDIALPLVAYSSLPSCRKVVDALALGALDYLERPFNSQALNETISRIDRLGEIYCNEQTQRLNAVGLVGRLSKRERQVLQCLIEGLSNREIGALLGISSRTVEIHRGHVTSKLGMVSSLTAVRLGLYAGVNPRYRPFFLVEASRRQVPSRRGRLGK